MLWLLFDIAAERFAIPSDRVDKVLPAVELHDVAQAPRGLAGAFSFRGSVTPVIDLADWMLGKKCPCKLSSRMILLQSDSQKFGLLAERVVELRTIDPAAAETTAGAWSGTLSLGSVIADEHGLLQLLDIDKLVAEARRQALLPASAAPAA